MAFPYASSNMSLNNPTVCFSSSSLAPKASFASSNKPFRTFILDICSGVLFFLLFSLALSASIATIEFSSLFSSSSEEIAKASKAPATGVDPTLVLIFLPISSSLFS